MPNTQICETHFSLKKNGNFTSNTSLYVNEELSVSDWDMFF